ncbi:MAG: ribonuclease HII [Desulfobulbus propionicus]|nr:MAG: ribonuclease HII [Desulfobulbus propionicus]
MSCESIRFLQGTGRFLVVAGAHTSLVTVHPGTQKDDPLSFEKYLYQQGYLGVAGVDEAGRGPLAGPVVAACVVLPLADESCLQYRDSKVLSAARREQLHTTLLGSDAQWGVGLAEPGEIEEINIHQASLLAMKRAVLSCQDAGNTAIDFLLIDGKFTVPLAVAQQPLVKGESKSASIAAASILAKVTRDQLMAEYHHQYPQYNFIRNQGYPTREHKRAIRLHGPCPIHRKTYKGVREFSTDCPKNLVDD